MATPSEESNPEESNLEESNPEESNLEESNLEELSDEECLALLATKDVGRLAVIVGERISIFPVNYAVDDATVVFRSDPGTKLTHSSLDPVAFEVDELDSGARSGWSVVVQGFGAEFTQGLDAQSERERELEILPWVVGEKAHWVRIIGATITGRRVRAT